MRVGYIDIFMFIQIVSNLIRFISLKCGVNVDESSSIVSDHFNHLSIHDLTNSIMLVSTEKLISSKLIVGATKDISSKNFLLYNGVALRLNTSNPLLIHLFSGLPSTYTSYPLQPILYYPHSIGFETVLIAALQVFTYSLKTYYII